ncbi:hypothetical protein NXS19_003648 [Fusarium pseudograminearum]|nr:hypothetical protein NXS19_003648 [Fusarium pseudograminearum]
MDVDRAHPTPWSKCVRPAASRFNGFDDAQRSKKQHINNACQDSAGCKFIILGTPFVLFISSEADKRSSNNARRVVWQSYLLLHHVANPRLDLRYHVKEGHWSHPCLNRHFVLSEHMRPSWFKRTIPSVTVHANRRTFCFSFPRGPSTAEVSSQVVTSLQTEASQ